MKAVDQIVINYEEFRADPHLDRLITLARALQVTRAEQYSGRRSIGHHPIRGGGTVGTPRVLGTHVVQTLWRRY